MGHILSFLQSLGKSLMLPIAVLPIAGLMLRLGQPDLLDIPFFAESGNTLFKNLPLLFAIGVAVGFSVDAAGAAALAGVVSYFTLTTAMSTIDNTLQMGVLAGIISGLIGGLMYNRYHTLKLPSYLAFFSGKRFVPISSAGVALVLAFIFSYIWPVIQNFINSIGNWMVQSHALGAAVFGLLNRLLLSIGLHQVLNTLCWFQFGDYTNAEGTVFHGDLSRFFAGDPNAGMFMSGFFPIFMFGLPAVALAIYLTAKKEKRKEVAGLFISLVLTAFLTGITEPLEYSFMFIAPLLYAFHAIFTGLALAISEFLNYKAGFTFSAGFIDLVLSWGKSTNPLTILWLGPAFFFLYFFVFYTAIRVFNLKTPGRTDDENDQTTSEHSSQEDHSMAQGESQYDVMAQRYIHALGGLTNLQTIDNCITRLRLQIHDMNKINESEIKRIGAAGIIKMGDKSLQIIIGSQVEFVATAMKKIAQGKNENQFTEQSQCCTTTEIPQNKPSIDLINTPSKKTDKQIIFKSPVEGQIVDLDQVPDATFSEKMAGIGLAINPTGNVFVAPISGTIISLPESGHAFVIRNENGVEALVHIGLETVKLNGRGFRILAEKGAHVKEGTPILQVNWNYVKEHAKSTVTPILIATPNLIADMQLLVHAGQNIKPGVQIIQAISKE